MAIFITAAPAPAPVGFKHSFLKGPFSAASVRKHSRKQARPHASVVLTKDPYTTLGLPAGASKEEIKKARRRLALKFHPDVCKGDSCAAKFIQIEQAYETIMGYLSGQKDSLVVESCYDNVHEGMMGVNDDSWEDWEEWMGWEGAGTRDYSSHINHAL